MTKELTLPERAKVALKGNDDELLALAKKSKVVTKVEVQSERDEAHNFLMVLRGVRVELTKRGKDARDDAVKFSKAIIAEEDRLIGLIIGEETRLQTLRDAFDEKVEAEKLRRANEEAERIAKAQAIMESLKPNLQFGDNSERIQQRLDEVQAIDLLECQKLYGEEFFEQACNLQNDTVIGLKKAMQTAVATEQVEKEAEERQKQAEADETKKQEAQRKANAEEQERLRKEAEALAKQREQQEAAQKKIDDETARLAAEKKAREETEAKAKAEEAAQAKARALLPDKTKLIQFAEDIVKVEWPEVTSEEAKTILSGVGTALGAIQSRILEAANKL